MRDVIEYTLEWGSSFYATSNSASSTGILMGPSFGLAVLTLFIKPVNCLNRGGQLSSFDQTCPMEELPASVMIIDRR